jgi:gliding motility-associated-like protein
MQIGNFASNQNPFVYPIDKSPIKIYVAGEDIYQCVNYDSVTLYYINCCGTLYVPNAFSPNGDGINDEFTVRSNAQKFEAYSLKIFNRFGQQIFETNDINEGWDGKFKGKQCDLSTYYYVISTKCYDAKETQLIKGDILLLK